VHRRQPTFRARRDQTLRKGWAKLPATSQKDQRGTTMRATDVNPRTRANSDSAPRTYWRPPGLPHVEVLERRETPPFRGYSDLYAFAFQAASVPTRWHYRGRLHVVPPGAIMLREPGETFGFADTSSVTILLISPDLISRVALEHFGDVNPVHWQTQVVRGSPFSEELLATIAALRDHRSHDANAVASGFIASCITQFREPMREAASNNLAKAGLARARDMLHTRYREAVTLSDLVVASESTSKQRLIRSFRLEFGFTPHEYLTHLRLSRARDLMRYGDDCGEAAHAVGFYDQSQMNRHFIKHVGITPGVYARASD
jgi:AraC-like DNA-binding protein